ncbi:Similar to Taf5l: TAF5-like RNA polymerase II p300/CBP-associated factor-associated factor 65 kDa subunit 5L (Mus musculus) [Cotesia congregata]|uniref:Similar to Taf5l: TAF5-like RNA polymerase II p300/CBP-associated factor-associated factor 65 kDa subunit 5L (Mus musculus) n=1 Tax=Cotesia congregata TaxID=51543 RepID=A0A8J2HBC4_COTCN|nr:Similar to Taf5l: TAF5-like RNA polymerase II p300/CBP-associated factor-associated factor 65 kDa subunit 5L (Mus musculus) [Cotesia congregata]
MKMKRSKIDIINSTVESYLKRRGYQDIDIFNKSDHNKTITSEESLLREMAQSATSTKNSIIFSAITNDVTAADQAYKKLRAWINLINDETVQEDLMNLLYPIFCHLYLEMLHAGNLQAAIEFFNSNRSDFITCKEKNFLDELSCVFSIQDAESKPIVNAFKIRKYRVDMSDESHNALQKYLAKHGHVIIMQIINIHVTINIKIENMMEEEEENDSGSKFGDININGHMEQNAGTGTDREMRELLEVIRGLNNNPYKPLKIFRIGNSIEKGSCATIPNKMDKFAVGFNENTIRLWPMGSTRLMRPLSKPPMKKIICGSEIDINIDNNDVEVESSGAVVLRGHTDAVHDMRFIHDSEILLSVSSDNDMRAWSMVNYSCIGTYNGHNYPIWCMDTSLDDTYIATGSHDRTAKLWTLDRKFPVRIFAGHYMDINSIKFHPNGNYLATGSADKSVKLWSKENGEALRSYPGVQSTIYCLAFSPDGKYLAAAGDDKTVLIWDLATDGLLNELKGHEGTIMNLDWSPDGQFIVSGDMNGTVRLWSAKIATNNGISIPMQSTSEIDIPAVQVLQSNGKAILTLRFNPRNNSPMCVVTA